MKKALVFAAVLGILSLSSCARKTCPAYSSFQEVPADTPALKA